MTKINVSTVPAVTINKGFLQITAKTRMGKDKKEIAAHLRSRSILVPEFVPNVSSKYVSIVVQALAETAKQQLAAQWEQNPDLKEVDSALYTEDSILLFAAREAESKKLNAATILAWFDQSDLKAEMVAKYNTAQINKFSLELQNIAAPVLSAEFYNEEKALRRIVSIAKHERDAEHETVAQMVRKLQAYVDRIIAARVSIGDVEEIDL